MYGRTSRPENRPATQAPIVTAGLKWAPGDVSERIDQPDEPKPNGHADQGHAAQQIDLVDDTEDRGSRDCEEQPHGSDELSEVALGRRWLHRKRGTIGGE